MDNTRQMIQFLSEQPNVKKIHHPGFEGYPDHALAQKLLPKGLAQS